MEKLQARDTERNLIDLVKRLEKIFKTTIAVKLDVWHFGYKHSIPIDVGYELWVKRLGTHYRFKTYAELDAWVDYTEILFRKF